MTLFTCRLCNNLYCSATFTKHQENHMIYKVLQISILLQHTVFLMSNLLLEMTYIIAQTALLYKLIYVVWMKIVAYQIFDRCDEELDELIKAPSKGMQLLTLIIKLQSKTRQGKTRQVFTIKSHLTTKSCKRLNIQRRCVITPLCKI